MSKITVLVKDITNIQMESSLSNKHLDDFYNNTVVKDKINKSINLIKRDNSYINFGLWIDYPDNWHNCSTISDSKITTY